MSKRLRAAALAPPRPVPPIAAPSDLVAPPPKEYFVAPEERWQHGQRQARTAMHRMATRVCSGVELLRRSDAISDADECAAERFYLDYVCGIEGVRESERVGDSGRGDAHDAQIARSEAITRHRAIGGIIGAGMTQWLVAFLVEDLSFCAMAERFMPMPPASPAVPPLSDADQAKKDQLRRAAGRREMKGRLTTLLMLLPGLYAAIDRKPK